MKKLLSILAVTAITTSAATSVVACGTKKDTEVWVVTDTGKVNDKSFNESAYTAGNTFLSEDLKRDTKVSFQEPKDGSELEGAYQTSRKNGGRALLLPGYQHATHIAKASELYAKSDSKDAGTVIFLDGSSAKKEGGNYENVIGIQFKAEISGFYSGIASILYNYSIGNNSPVLTAFGGGEHNAFATSNALAGYFASINFMNLLIEEQSKAGTKDGEPTLLDNLLNVVGKKFEDLGNKKVQYAKSQDMSKDGPQILEKQFFTGDFTDGGGATLSSVLVGEGASVIFPFAGPQTEDALKEIRNDKNSKALVVGADVDQTALYKNYQDQFITSALKDIKGAGRAALIHSKAYEGEDFKDSKDVVKGYDKDGVEVTDKWDGQDIWFGGKIASGGKNKITSEQADKIDELLKEAGNALSEKYHSTPNIDKFETVFNYKYIEELAKAAIEGAK